MKSCSIRHNRIPNEMELRCVGRRKHDQNNISFTIVSSGVSNQIRCPQERKIDYTRFLVIENSYYYY